MEGIQRLLRSIHHSSTKSVFSRSHTFTQSTCMALSFFFQVGNHCPLLSKNSALGRLERSLQGLLAIPSSKQPMVPPTATLRMRQKSASKGAHLYLENYQGLALPVPLRPERYQQLMVVWFTKRTRLVSLSRQVQITLSSQQRPQVWKSSARVVPLIVYSALVLQNWLVVQSEPQCRVDPKVQGPPPYCLGYPTFPRLSMMSISPLVGQPPYSKYLGISQMAGHSQSPLGNLALTSTLPKVKVKDSTVVNLPLKTGLMQLTPSDCLLHPLLKGAVQKSPGEPPHISQKELFLTAPAPIFSSVGTGWMQRMELLVQVVVLLLSQIWNSLLPPPAMVRSWRHLRKSSLSNSSQKTSLEHTEARRRRSNNSLDICQYIQCLKSRRRVRKEEIINIRSKRVQLCDYG